MQRYWLDWNHSCLAQAAGWIIHRSSPDSHLLDLRRTTCLLPGRRAARLLLQYLINEAQQRDLRIVPPGILTPGDLAATFLRVDSPAATSDESLFAWINAVRRSSDQVRESLLPHPPDENDHLAWLDLARTFRDLHSELAGSLLTFNDVAAAAEQADRPLDAQRWRALTIVQTALIALLQSAGLVDSHELWSRALRDHRLVDDLPDRLILIGVVELNARQRAILDRLADRATALIHAPSSLADHFDDLGCVLVDALPDVTIPVRTDQIEVADRPADQAQEVLRAIASRGNDLSPGDITVGLGDEALAEPLIRAGRWAGLNFHAASGRELHRAPPYRLLAALAEWLDEPRFANFAALIRHPDIEAWLHHKISAQDDDSDSSNTTSGAIEDWLTLLDRYFTDHLHERFTGDWLQPGPRTRPLQRIYQAITTNLLAPFDESPRRLAEWVQPLLHTLNTVYEHRDPPARTTEACATIVNALHDLVRTPPSLDPVVDAAAALRIVLRLLDDNRLTADVRHDQIEMLGWLELHLDPADTLIITSVNEGIIPAGAASDPWLPDSLRARLGLPCNASRYARDAYLLTAILNSRERVTLIAGRRNPDDEPLLPSRLLLACDDDELVNRVESFSRDRSDEPHSLPAGIPKPAIRTRFVIPPLPDHLEPPTLLSVTAFRDYINCPYRFALQHVLRLREYADHAAELEAWQFGTLAHDVLEAFGKDTDVRTFDDDKGISAFLLDTLGDLVTQRFGRQPAAAVRVQCARLERRLEQFAIKQSELRRDGWTIHLAEFTFPDTAHLDIPGDEPILLRGKIDRIDRNEHTGDWRIIDYKTGDNPRSPHEVHHGRKRIPDDLQWEDLQLPLYHHLARQDGYKGNIQLGYFVLPRSIEKINFLPAEWETAHLEDAVDFARDIVRDIRRGLFKPNPDYAPPFDSFGRICRTSAVSLGSLDLESADQITAGRGGAS